jgi:hypothetical protein
MMKEKQTKNSPNPNCCGTSTARGQRLDPPKGAQQPGRGLSKTQTRNSKGNKP